MKLILNESKIIQDCIQNGIVNKSKPSSTISLLAKYYNTLGKSEEQIISCIDTFMIENYEDYNSVTWADIVEGIVKQAVKANRSLIEINEVYIYEAEIEFIKSLDGEKSQKLAFTYLVYAKIANQINPLNNNWVAGKHRSDLFKDANVSDTGLKQLYTLHDLIKEDILYTTNSIDNSSLNVGNYISTEGEVALTITDFRQLGLQWLLYIGTKGVCKCAECGVLYKRKSNKQKVCTPCSKEKQKELDRIYQKNKRKINSRVLENAS